MSWTNGVLPIAGMAQTLRWKLVSEHNKHSCWDCDAAAELAVVAARSEGAAEGVRGLGVLAEYGAERWLREAMIIAIWEGTSHHQILDGLEVMERKRAHKMLFRRLAGIASAKELQDMESEVEQHLKLPPEEREELAEPLFRRVAAFAAETLAHKSK